MKKILGFALVLCMTTSMIGCNNNQGQVNSATETVKNESTVETVAETEMAKQTEEETTEDDTIDDEAWDNMDSLGMVHVENGIFTVDITIPADFIEEGTTQDSLDAEAGEGYLSAVLNEDGTVTYKVTKRQHKEMMNQMIQNMDTMFQEMIESEEYSITEINHNNDYTLFDVTLESNEIGLGDMFSVYAFMITGNYYNLFAGREIDHVVVSFYNPAGELIETVDSADLE